MFLGIVLASMGFTALAEPTHALTVYGEAPRYAQTFRHFDYVNPDAPKGGTLRRSATEIGQFDHIRRTSTKVSASARSMAGCTLPWQCVHSMSPIRSMA